MELNKPPVFIVTIILLLCANALCAYCEEESRVPEAGYYIDYSGDKPRIIQKLVWDDDEYAMHYEAEMQRFYSRETSQHDEIDSDGSADRPSGYYEYDRKKTTDCFLEVILPPGQFRYNVTPYDYLGRPGESSEWIEFNIITAYHSVIEKFTPEAFFLDQRRKRELIISGTNLSDESEINLRNAELDLFPVGRNFSGDNTVILFFDDEKLPVGIYDIHIINPGGIESITSSFRIGYRKPLDVFFKTVYAPIVPVYGRLYELFPEGFYFTGFSFALELISSKRAVLNAGFELSYAWYALNPALSFKTNLSDIWDGLMNISDGIQFHDIDINLSLQKRFFKRRMAVTFRLGSGLSINKGAGIYKDGNLNAHLNLGFSYMALLFDIFHLEIGADFVHHFIDNSSGIIKPKLALVWKF